MYIPIELQKENAFIDVAIPSNKLFFNRVGASPVKPESFSGDEMVDPYLDKIEQIEDFKAYVESVNSKDSE